LSVPSRRPATQKKDALLVSIFARLERRSDLTLVPGLLTVLHRAPPTPSSRVAWRQYYERDFRGNSEDFFQSVRRFETYVFRVRVLGERSLSYSEFLAFSSFLRSRDFLAKFLPYCQMYNYCTIFRDELFVCRCCF